MEQALAALGGTVLGGIIALVTTAYFGWRAERDRRLGLAYSLFFRFFLMADITNRICRDLDAVSPDRNGLHWPMLRPLAGVRFPDSTFTAEELSLFASERGPLFTEKLLVAANHLHLLEDLLIQYNAERRSLGEECRLRGLVEMHGMVGRISADEGNYKALAPKIIEVDVLAKSLWDAARNAKRAMSTAADEIGPKLKATLNDARFHLVMGDKDATVGQAIETARCGDE